MQTFTDAEGRDWVLNLTVGCLRRIRANTGIDLTAPEQTVDEYGHPDPQSQLTLSQRVTGELMLGVDVLFAAIALQADQRNLTVDQFCEDLPPDLCRIARLKFLEEWENFFRQLGRDDQQSIVRAAVELQRELELQLKAASDRIKGSAMEKLRSEIATVMTEACGSGSTNTPASSGSTPSP